MKTNPTDRMKDPFFAQLLFQIETLICQADDDSKTRGMQLTDSQMRSTLIKTQKKLQGGEPEIAETTERDKILARLATLLLHAPIVRAKQSAEQDDKGEQVRVTDWIKALETVEDSIQTRKSGLPGSRDYLDYIHDFIGQAKGLNPTGESDRL